MIRARVARNAISNYIATTIVLGSGFVITPLILAKLGPTQYGLWVLVASITAYGTLFNFGIGTALIKYVAEFSSRDEPALARSLITTTLYMYLGVGAGVLVFSLVLAGLFPLLFRVDPGSYDTVRSLVIVSGLALSLSTLMAVPAGVLQGLQRFDLVNTLGLLNLLLSPIAGLAVLMLGGNVVGFVAASIPISLTVQLLGHALIRRTAPDYAIRWRGARRDLVRMILRYSWAMLVLDLADRIKLKSDEVVVGALLPITLVTPYYLARRLSEIPKLLTLQFQKVLMPIASELHAADDQSRLKAVFLTGTRLTPAIFSASGITIAALARPALIVWVGPDYAIHAPIVVVLVIAGFIELSQYPAGAVLQGITRYRPLAAIAMASAAANLFISIVLIQRIGIIGAAFGTLISVVLEVFLLALPYALRVLGVPARALVTQAFLPALLPAIPTLAVLLALQQFVDLAVWPLLLGAGLLGVVVYALGYLLFGATPDERQSYKTLLASRFSRSSHK